MNSIRHSTSKCTLMKAFGIIVFGMIFIHAESIISDDQDHYVESNDNTRAAIDELNDVLRHLFPIVPDKNHFLWNSRHKGVMINHNNRNNRLNNRINNEPDNNDRKIIVKTNHEHQRPFNAEHSMNHIHSKQIFIPIDKLFEPDYDMKAANQPMDENEIDSSVRAGSSHFQSNSMVPGDNNNRSQMERTILGTMMKISKTTTPHNMINVPSNHHGTMTVIPNDQLMDLMANGGNRVAIPSTDTVLASATNNNNDLLSNVHSTSSSSLSDRDAKLYNLMVKTFKGSKNNYNKPLNIPKMMIKPELATITTGKRGPECMRRCITQGLLHPVQCHSLC
ncbi:hypothetical protein BLOT_001475 [Blomia tropicalis]|nr:hypothetical protein BLOT_001475 [Blomia tropicalis]